MFVPQSDSSDTKYIHFAEIGRISIKGGLTRTPSARKGAKI